MRSKTIWPAVAGTAAMAAAFALPGGAAYATTNPPLALGNTSAASGNQALLSLNLPVNVCGLAVAVLGSAQSGCQGGATASGASAGSGSGGGNGSGGTNTGNTSVGSGNQVSAPISVPANVCGVSIAVLGTASSGCQGGSTVGSKPPGSKPPGGPGGKPPGGPGGKPPGGGGGKPPGGGGGKPPGGGTKHHKPPKVHHVYHNRPPHQGGAWGGGASGGGSSLGSAATSTAALASGSLPTTGVNLLGIVAGALGCIVTGAGALVADRRRRRAGSGA